MIAIGDLQHLTRYFVANITLKGREDEQRQE